MNDNGEKQDTSKSPIREFKKCPACGSEERFFESLSKELKDKGFARPEWNMCLDMKQGAVVDPQKEVVIPIGSEVPGYLFKTDICLNCGTIYAVVLQSGPVKKSIAPVQFVPNRAQRRQMGREIPHFNNPLLS